MSKRRSKSASEVNHGEQRSKPSRPVKVAFSDYRFVRIEFTEAEKAEFRSLLASGEFDSSNRDDWYREGYKLSVSWDVTHNTFVASLTGQYRDQQNAGLVLTARGNSEAIALAALEFKHLYLCSDGLWSAAEDSRGGSYSDIG